MADEKKAREILRREYGIKTDADLWEAIRKMKKLNIGIFVSPPQYPQNSADSRDAG